MEFYFELGWKFAEELLMSSYLLIYLLASNKLVYKLTIELEI